jgi:RIO kinase 1
MRMPAGLLSLLDNGLITEVVRPLLSGKEAQVYLVLVYGEERVAKVYKEANQRSFKNRAVYSEGRRGRNSRDRRAIAKGSKHGRAQEEEAWRSAEVDMMFRLRDAGVRVPTPYVFDDGVLVMELVKDAYGEPAPRLGEVDMDAAYAEVVFDQLIAEVVKMLCAGVVHGDLSDFNVLMTPEGPVIIDFPQSLDAAGNQSARKILIRDVANLNRFLLGFGPTKRPLQHAQEMWALYTRGELQPDTKLTGRFKGADNNVNMMALMAELEADERDEMARRAAATQ